MEEHLEYPLTPDESYKPSFVKGDKVKLKQEGLNYDNTHAAIADKKLTVDKVSFKSWDGINAECVYLIQEEGVRNPYLAEHFEKV